MIALQDITGPSAAFVAGAITSLHCIGMCGPIACATCVKNGKNMDLSSTAIYHGMRLISYSITGLLAGLIGQRVSGILFGGPAQGMVWVFVIFFLIVAAGLDKKLRLPAIGMFFIQASGAKLPVFGQAALLGALTPLIPCAPLYLVIVTAALSSSGLSGALIMAAFGAGTIPLMFVLQSQYARLGARLSPQTADILRRSLAVMSIFLLVYRGVSGPATCIICH